MLWKEREQRWKLKARNTIVHNAIELDETLSLSLFLLKFSCMGFRGHNYNFPLLRIKFILASGGEGEEFSQTTAEKLNM